MSFLIEKDEATAGRRFVPFRLFDSTGTAPFTTGSGNTMLASLNGAAQLSLGSVSVVSANAGMYGFQLTQSNVSTLGSLALYTDNVANYPQHVATVQIVNNNPFSTQSNVTSVGVSGINAGVYSGVTLGINNIAPNTYSGVSVGASNFAPGVYSGVSFSIRDSGIATSSYQAGNYSGVSVEVKTSGIATNSINSATYSGVTFGINNIAPGTYSGVSIEVKSGGIQTGSVGVGNYSGVSVEVKTSGIATNSINSATYSGVTFGINNITAGTYSGVTLGVNNIAAGSYSGVTIDGARFLSTAGERSVASSWMSTNLGNTRYAQEALFVLRNRVLVSGSTGTVYQTDDTTSQFTFSVTTGASPIVGVDPVG